MKNIYFLTLCTLFVGCQRKYAYIPYPNQQDIQVIYNQGTPAIYTNINDADYRIDLGSFGKKNMNLSFFISNPTDSLLTILPDGIKVTGFDEFGRSIPFKVYTANEYIRKIKKQNAIIITASVLLAVGAASASANSNDSNNNNDDNNLFLYSPTTIVNTPPPPPSPQDGLIRAQTLFSGESLYGVIKVRAQRAYTHHIKVEIPTRYGNYLSINYSGPLQIE